MSEDPKQVLPEDGQATLTNLEEVCAETAVKHQLGQSDGDHREGQDDQEIGSWVETYDGINSEIGVPLSRYGLDFLEI